MKKPWYRKWYVWVAIGLGIIILNNIYLHFQKNQSESTAAIEQKVTSQREQSSTEATKAPKVTEINTVSFAAQELYSDSNCEISLESGDSEKLTLLYKNKSDNNYSFSIHSMAVNGVMLEFLELSAEVPAGSQAKKSFDIGDYWSAEDFGNQPIDTVQVNIWVYEKNHKEFETGIIKFNVSGSENASYKFDKSQTQSFSNVDVSCRSFSDNRVEMVVSNRSNTFITFDVNNVVVNGWAFDVTDLMFQSRHSNYSEVYSQCESLWILTLSEKTMKEKGISNIEKFECTLNIKPNDDYHNSFDTDTIIFTK